MHPLSPLGPGVQAPTSSRPTRIVPAAPATPQESFVPAVDPGLPRRRGATPARPDLIHPATAAEFRQVLEEILDRLPPRLLAAVAEQGYRIHVVDLEGSGPLTLEPQEVDPEVGQEVCGDRASSLREVAAGRGAADPAQVAEFVELLLRGNPDLAVLADCPGESPVPPGHPLRVPAFGYLQGRRVPWEAWEFLTRPRRTFLAGMVTHGPVAGLRGEENRILFWDLVFRRGGGLTDWYVLHEMGHTTDYAFAFRRPEAWREWRSRLEVAFGAGLRVTRYAGESVTEYFAEGFAAWATPPRAERPEPGDSDLAAQRLALDREVLEARDPALAGLIEEAFASL